MMSVMLHGAWVGSLTCVKGQGPKVRCAQVCITAAGLVRLGIAGSEHWP